ncbi:hypothetical protein TRVA0_080S00100 [Trichomonascus vanleenenianus]|uniref:Sin4p n=1 Tax=Trichomonascus vanleenenianus TaxID=2268995 RepID=UPI003EC99F82
MASKIARLQRSGCSDSIAWSKNGAIARIWKSTAYISYLVCKNGRDWEIAAPVAINAIEGALLCHVSWSPSGADLACIDTQGDISIHSLASGTGVQCVFNPKTTTNAIQQQYPNHETSAIVGFKWLDLDKGLLVASPAIRNPPQSASSGGSGGSSRSDASSLAQYGLCHSKPMGPYNPLPNKQACVAITRKGELKLMAQSSEELRYFELSAMLDSGSSSSALLTHASIKGTKDNALQIVTYSNRDNAVKVYRVVIEWAPKLNNNQLQSTAFAKLVVKRLANTMIAPQQPVTHLFCVPNLQLKGPNIQPNGTESDELLYVITSDGTKTKGYQYELSTKPITLHSSFFNLSTRRDSAGASGESDTSLILQEQFDIDSPVLSIASACQDTFIYYACADGSVNFIRRQPYPTLSNTSARPLLNLTDVGFMFPKPEEIILDMCLSPNMSSYLYLVPADKEEENCPQLKINYMSLGNISDKSDDELGDTAVALALRNSICCFNSLVTEDVLIIMKRILSQLQKKDTKKAEWFLHTLLREAHRGINFTLDLPKDYQVDKIIVNPSLQRLLSMQVALGTDLEWSRNAMSRVGWGILNLRLLAFALTFILRAVSTQSKSNTGMTDLEQKANHLQSIVGLVRWLTDLIVFICQDLYLMTVKPNAKVEALASNSASASGSGTGPLMNSVPLALLLGKVPRMLLLYSLRGVRGLEQVAAKLVEQEQNSMFGVNHTALRRLRETTQFSPQPLATFEKMLSDIDTAMKNLYNSAAPHDRLELEHSLILRGDIPAKLGPMVRGTFDAYKKNLLPDTNVPVLYFYDASWVGLSATRDSDDNDVDADTESLAACIDSLAFDNDGDCIDVIRKTLQSKLSPTRYCTRCGNISRLYDDEMLSQWTVAFQKYCLCGGNWYTKESH